MNLLAKPLALFLFAMVFISGCKKDNPYTPEKETAEINAWKAKMKMDNVAYDSTATKIYYILDKTKIGTGANVRAGNKVTVNYSGTFMDGSVFDSSNGYTYVHKATDQRMISGWEEGIQLLNKGSRATFLIPSAKGYGTAGSGSIPPYTPLIFVIEVVDIK